MLAFLAPFLVNLWFYLFNKLAFEGGVAINLKSVLFGGFLLLLLSTLLTGLLGSLQLTTLVAAVIFVVFTLVNCIKLYYTNDPVLFSDFKYLNDFREIICIVDDSFRYSFVTMVLPAVVFTATMGLLVWKMRKFRFNIRKLWMRCLMVLVPFVFFWMLLHPTAGSRTFLMRNIYDRKGLPSDRYYINNSRIYGVNGIVSGMYFHYLENMLLPPDGYEEEAVVLLAEGTGSQTEGKLGQPNIIVYFSESNFDISKVSELQFNQPINGNFQRLKEEGISFEMVSPTFGGVTGNVEFEFLTGANLAYFGSGYVPYIELYTNDHYYDTPAITHELKNNGYETKIVLCTGPRLFNCGKFYGYADFDSTEFNYEEPLLSRYLPKEILKGGNISEEHIVDEIIREFDNKNPGKKEFYMVLTMQTHSPYNTRKYDEYDVSLVSSPADATLNDALETYAQGIFDTDVQLQRLYEYIQTLEEPTLLVFFGDHLPQVADEHGTSMLDILPYFNTGDELLDIYRKYNTSALLLANFPLEKTDFQYVSPDTLSAFILNNMDLELSPYYRWLYTQLDTLGGMNMYVVQDAEGDLHYPQTLTEEQKEAYLMRARMQYYYFINDYQ